MAATSGSATAKLPDRGDGLSRLCILSAQLHVLISAPPGRPVDHRGSHEAARTVVIVWRPAAAILRLRCALPAYCVLPAADCEPLLQLVAARRNALRAVDVLGCPPESRERVLCAPAGCPRALRPTAAGNTCTALVAWVSPQDILLPRRKLPEISPVAAEPPPSAAVSQDRCPPNTCTAIIMWRAPEDMLRPQHTAAPDVRSIGSRRTEQLMRRMLQSLLSAPPMVPTPLPSPTNSCTALIVWQPPERVVTLLGRPRLTEINPTESFPPPPAAPVREPAAAPLDTSGSSTAPPAAGADVSSAGTHTFTAESPFAAAAVPAAMPPATGGSAAAVQPESPAVAAPVVVAEHAEVSVIARVCAGGVQRDVPVGVMLAVRAPVAEVGPGEASPLLQLWRSVARRVSGAWQDCMIDGAAAAWRAGQLSMSWRRDGR
eukprot:jgi/Ulvmu1/8320/UM042_0026.1